MFQRNTFTLIDIQRNNRPGTCKLTSVRVANEKDSSWNACDDETGGFAVVNWDSVGTCVMNTTQLQS